jgi:hypothetical protein
VYSPPPCPLCIPREYRNTHRGRQELRDTGQDTWGTGHGEQGRGGYTGERKEGDTRGIGKRGIHRGQGGGGYTGDRDEGDTQGGPMYSLLPVLCVSLSLLL